MFVAERIQKKNPYVGGTLVYYGQTYESQGGKYYNLYVTSPNNTTVFIQVTGGSTSKWPITAGQILTFTVPLGWEVTSSGVIEQKLSGMVERCRLQRIFFHAILLPVTEC